MESAAADRQAREDAGSGTEVLYEAYPSMFRTSPFWFVISLLLIPAFGLGIVILLVWFIKTRMDRIAITPGHIVWSHGLLSKQNVELSLASVRTVKINQSLLQRLLDSGNVEIYTAGDQAEIRIAGLPDPGRIREIIKANQQAS